MVSSSEDERDVNIVDSGDDEGSCMSSSNLGQLEQKPDEELVTQFSKKMLQRSSSPTGATSAVTEKFMMSSISDHIQGSIEDEGIFDNLLLLTS